MKEFKIINEQNMNIPLKKRKSKRPMGEPSVFLREYK